MSDNIMGSELDTGSESLVQDVSEIDISEISAQEELNICICGTSFN